MFPRSMRSLSRIKLRCCLKMPVKNCKAFDNQVRLGPHSTSRAHTEALPEIERRIAGCSIYEIENGGQKTSGNKKILRNRPGVTAMHGATRGHPLSIAFSECCALWRRFEQQSPFGGAHFFSVSFRTDVLLTRVSLPSIITFDEFPLSMTSFLKS